MSVSFTSLRALIAGTIKSLLSSLSVKSLFGTWKMLHNFFWVNELINAWRDFRKESLEARRKLEESSPSLGSNTIQNSSIDKGKKLNRFRKKTLQRLDMMTDCWEWERNQNNHMSLNHHGCSNETEESSNVFKVCNYISFFLSDIGNLCLLFTCLSYLEAYNIDLSFQSICFYWFNLVLFVHCLFLLT